jgi:hypothetical protein
VFEPTLSGTRRSIVSSLTDAAGFAGPGNIHTIFHVTREPLANGSSA